MYLEYPKSWLLEPTNHKSNVNFSLSENDTNNIMELFKDPNYNPVKI